MQHCNVGSRRIVHALFTGGIFGLSFATQKSAFANTPLCMCHINTEDLLRTPLGHIKQQQEDGWQLVIRATCKGERLHALLAETC